MEHALFLYEEAKKKLKDFIEFKHIPVENIALSFSGGRDSTIMLKMIEELGLKNKIKVVFFNTTMEFEATLEFVNKKIQEGWNIEIRKPIKNMPTIYKEYGKPFHSKLTSEMIHRLQKHNFNFKEDTYKSFEELIIKYPNCRVSLKWLTGKDRITMCCPNWVKRALVMSDVKIANKCCEYLKKKPYKQFEKDNNIILSLIGVRQDESLLRRAQYRSCIWEDDKKFKFFPLLYFNQADIESIVKIKNIELSRAYTEYKQNRTGCVGCPFGRNHLQELQTLKEYEPKKAKIVEYLYSDIYELDKYKKR